MKKIKSLLVALVMGILVVAPLTACSAPSEVASQNISNDADNFKVDRRIVVVNLITNQPLLEIEGRCSITNAVEKKMLGITCQIGRDEYTKTYAGYTDGANMVFTIEQLRTTKTDAYHYKLNFFPSQIIPTIVTG